MLQSMGFSASDHTLPVSRVYFLFCRLHSQILEIRITLSVCSTFWGIRNLDKESIHQYKFVMNALMNSLRIETHNQYNVAGLTNPKETRH